MIDFDQFWLILIDFNQQVSEKQKTMYGERKEYSCRGQINKAALAMPRLHFTAFVL